LGFAKFIGDPTKGNKRGVLRRGYLSKDRKKGREKTRKKNEIVKSLLTRPYAKL